MSSTLNVIGAIAENGGIATLEPGKDPAINENAQHQAHANEANSAETAYPPLPLSPQAETDNQPKSAVTQRNMNPTIEDALMSEEDSGSILQKDKPEKDEPEKDEPEKDEPKKGKTRTYASQKIEKENDPNRINAERILLQTTPYDVLNVKHNIPTDKARRAWRKAALHVHSDKNSHFFADEAYYCLQEAIDTIESTERRKEFDKGFERDKNKTAYSWLSASGLDLAKRARHRKNGDPNIDTNGDFAQDMSKHEEPLPEVKQVHKKATSRVRKYLQLDDEDKEKRKKVVAKLIGYNEQIEDINFKAGRARNSNAIPVKSFSKAEGYRSVAESNIKRDTLEALARCDQEIKDLVKFRGLPEEWGTYLEFEQFLLDSLVKYTDITTSLPRNAFPRYRKIVDQAEKQNKLNEENQDSESELDWDLASDSESDAEPDNNAEQDSATDNTSGPDIDMPDAPERLNRPKHPDLQGVDTSVGRVVAFIPRYTKNRLKAAKVVTTFKCISWNVNNANPMSLVDCITFTQADLKEIDESVTAQKIPDLNRCADKIDPYKNYEFQGVLGVAFEPSGEYCMGDLYACIQLEGKPQFVSRSALRKMIGQKKADENIDKFCANSGVKTDWEYLQQRRLQGRRQRFLTYPDMGTKPLEWQTPRPPWHRSDIEREAPWHRRDIERVAPWHRSDNTKLSVATVNSLADIVEELALSQTDIIKRFDALEVSLRKNNK